MSLCLVDAIKWEAKMEELDVFSSDILLNILPRSTPLATYSRSINSLNQVFSVRPLFNSLGISDININMGWFGSLKAGTEIFNYYLATNLKLPEKLQMFNTHITLSLLGISHSLMGHSYLSHLYFKEAFIAKGDNIGINLNYIISMFHADKISLIDAINELEKHINVNDSCHNYDLFIFYSKAVMYFKNCIKNSFFNDESVKLINHNIDKIIEDSNNNPQLILKAKFLRISLLFFVDKYSNKEEIIKILDSLKEEPLDEEVNFLKSYIYYEVGDFKEALEEIKFYNLEGENLLPKMPLLITLYTKIGDFKAAENLIKRAEELISEFPEFPEFPMSIFLHKIYMDYVVKNYNELLAKLENAKTEQFFDEVVVQLEIFRGLSYLKLGRKEEAYKILADILDSDSFFIGPILILDEKNAVALTYRAHLYNKKGLYVESLNCLDAVCDQSHIPFLIEKVMSLYGLNKLEEANKFLDIIKELNFSEYNYRNALCVGRIPLFIAIRIKRLVGHYKESLELCEKINNFPQIDIHLKYPILFEKALVLLKAGRFDELLEFCEQVIKESPPNIFQFQQVKLDAFLNKLEPEYENAIEYCSQLIKVNNIDGYFWLNRMGWILSTIGKCEEAIDCYDKAISLIPIYSTRELLSIMCGKAQALYIEGDYNVAIRLCNQAIELASANKFETQEFWLIKGQILFTKNKYEEAVDCYKQTLVIKDDFLPALENMVFVCILQKNIQEANLYLEKLKSLCPNIANITPGLFLLINLYEYVFNGKKEINKIVFELDKFFQQSNLCQASYKFRSYEMLTEFSFRNDCFEQADICLDECLKITKNNQRLLALKVDIKWHKHKKSLSDSSEAIEENHEILMIEAIEKIQIKYQELFAENERLKMQESALVEALESTHQYSINMIKEEKEKNVQQESTLKNLLDQIQEVQTKYDKKKIVKENKELMQKNKSLKHHNDILNQNYENLQNQHKSVVSEKSKFFNQNHKLQNTLEDFQIKNKWLNKKIQTNETEKLAWEKEKRELLAKLEKSETRNKELEKENRCLKQTILELQEIIKKQSNAIEKLESRDREKQEKIDCLERRMKKLESDQSDEIIEEKISEKVSSFMQKFAINFNNNNSKKSNDDTHTEIQTFQNNK